MKLNLKHYGRNNVELYFKNKFCYKIPKFYFSDKKKSAQEKMKLILERNDQNYKANQEEIKIIEDKTHPMLLHLQKFRIPIYLSTLPLIWSHPFSSIYVYSLLFSNHYLIFLTALDAGLLFSLGLLKYNLITIKANHEAEEVKLRTKVTRKRLFLMITFFLSLILASILATKYENGKSFFVLLLSNIYLYWKFGLHVTLNGADKIFFQKRMNILSINIFLTIIMMVVISKKKKMIYNNIKY